MAQLAITLDLTVDGVSLQSVLADIIEMACLLDGVGPTYRDFELRFAAIDTLVLGQGVSSAGSSCLRVDLAPSPALLALRDWLRAETAIVLLEDDFTNG